MEIKIIRKIDELGRVAIPKDVRTALNLRTGNSVEITIKDGTVILKNSGGNT